MIIFRILAGMLGIMASCQALSQVRPMDAASIMLLKDRVKMLAKTTSTISCDFVQEKEMSMISEKIVSKGKFCFKKEKMLRWEYLQPVSYVIVIRDDQITVRDENKVNRFSTQSNKVFLEVNRIILGSIQGTLLADEQNFSPAYSENAASWIVRLKVLSPKLKASLSEIVIRFDRNDYAVSGVELIEPGGDYTRISFTSRKLNQPVADEMFMVR